MEPKAKEIEKTLEMHNDVRHYEFYWMRNHPEDPDVLGHLKVENEHVDGLLDQKLLAGLMGLFDSEVDKMLPVARYWTTSRIQYLHHRHPENITSLYIEAYTSRSYPRCLWQYLAPSGKSLKQDHHRTVVMFCIPIQPCQLYIAFL